MSITAITLIQPMAAAIAYGSKRIENRPQDLPQKLRGVSTIVAIHGGKKWDDDYADTVLEIDGMLNLEGGVPILRYAERVQDAGIVGLMRLTGRVFMSLDQAKTEHAGDVRWFGGPFGYELDAAVALPKALPCRGLPGWWPVPPEVEQDWSFKNAVECIRSMPTLPSFR